MASTCSFSIADSAAAVSSWLPAELPRNERAAEVLGRQLEVLTASTFVKPGGLMSYGIDESELADV